MITGGAEYGLASGEVMPQEISGWTGWVGRMLAQRHFAFTGGEVLAINGIACSLALILLLRYAQKCGSDRPG
jgi:hypothetical protein